MSKKRILVIDDNPSIQADFRKILAPPQSAVEGLQAMAATLFEESSVAKSVVSFDVDCASQGQEGYAKILEGQKAGHPYAMAFVDVRMPPGWDGIETVERIWKEYPDIQVVICTAYSDYSWDDIVKKLGHPDQLLILKKPFDNIEVMQMAQALTEKWRLTRESQMHLQEVERKVVEQTREFQEFAYGVSHDLQEPLRKVVAFGDRLRSKCGEQMGPDGLGYLDRMQDAAKRMRTLITDLLALSRISTQAKPFVSVDLNTIVAEVLSDLEVLCEQVGGKVEVNTLPTIMADPTQMRQLLQNLIGNALKFRKKDVSPVIQIRAEQLTVAVTGEPVGESDSGCWQITVRDNGIGFDEKYRERIFEVFQRLHGRGEYEGSGIGLSLCRKIVNRHGGTIMADSVFGEGATFLIKLPEKKTDLVLPIVPAPAEVSREPASAVTT